MGAPFGAGMAPRSAARQPGLLGLGWRGTLRCPGWPPCGVGVARGQRLRGEPPPQRGGNSSAKGNALVKPLPKIVPSPEGAKYDPQSRPFCWSWFRPFRAGGRVGVAVSRALPFADESPPPSGLARRGTSPRAAWHWLGAGTGWNRPMRGDRPPQRGGNSSAKGNALVKARNEAPSSPEGARLSLRSRRCCFSWSRPFRAHDPLCIGLSRASPFADEWAPRSGLGRGRTRRRSPGQPRLLGPGGVPSGLVRDGPRAGLGPPATSDCGANGRPNGAATRQRRATPW